MIRLVFDDMPTISDLGQRVKAKYPGQYDDLSDLDVGNRVKGRYPGAYDDFTDVPAEQRTGIERYASGLGKSIVGQTVEAATAGERLLHGTLKTLLPKSLEPSFGLDRPFESSAEQLLPEKIRTGLKKPATSTAERAGELTGEIAPFLIPSRAISGAGRAGGKLITEGLKRIAPRIAERAGETLGRAGAEAISAGGIRGLQTGGDIEEAAATGAAAAAFPIAGTALKSIASATKAGRTAAAERLVNSLIRPLLKDLSYGKNPGRAVVREGITATSLEELGQKVAQRTEEVGNEIQGTLRSQKYANTRIDATDAMQPLIEALSQAKKAPRTNAGLIQRLRDSIDDILQIDEKGVATRSLSDLTPESATQLKIDIGKITKFTGSPSDDQLVNRALKRVYGGIREKIEKEVPEIKDLNERYADLLSARIAATYRDKIETRQALISLKGGMTGIGGALITSLATGGAAVPALLVGASGVALEKALGSPLVKTNVARWLAQSSKIERESLFRKIPGLRDATERIFGKKSLPKAEAPIGGGASQELPVVTKSLGLFDRMIERRTQIRAHREYPKLKERYLANPSNTARAPDGSLQSVILNTDEWRSMFPEYRGTNAPVVHEAASYLNNRLYREMLVEQQGKGNKTIAVLAGGGGSGKGSATKKFYNTADYPIVLDQVFSNFEKGVKKLDEARNKFGYNGQVVFVDRPPQAAVASAIDRSVRLAGNRKLPRTVPVHRLVEDNIQAREVARKILSQRSDIPVSVIDNSGALEDAMLIENSHEALDYLSKKIYDQSVETRNAYGILKERTQSRTLSPQLAKGFK